MSRPSRLNSWTCRIASSPSSITRNPARAYAVAPSSLAPITAGVHEYARAVSSHERIAGPHASTSPSGSPLARLTPLTTRYVTAALPLGENTTALSRRVAK